MKQWTIVCGVALALGVQAVALAQARPDFSGTWRLNVSKSAPNVAGNTPNIPFPSQIVARQTPTDISVESTSIRQQPVSAVYKLDGSSNPVPGALGWETKASAAWQGANLVVTTRRSMTGSAKPKSKRSGTRRSIANGA